MGEESHPGGWFQSEEALLSAGCARRTQVGIGEAGGSFATVVKVQDFLAIVIVFCSLS